MSMTPITTHVQDAIGRLWQQYKGVVSIEALISAFTQDIQDLENAFQQLATDRFLDTAYGIQLDLLGDIVGASRNGASDDDYRARIKVRIVENLSFGEPDRLINVYAFLLGATQVQYQEHYPAGVQLMANAEIPAGQETLIYRELQRVVAAGVRVDWIGTFDSMEAFAMDGIYSPIETPGQGFGDLNDPSVGGKLGTLVVPLGIGFAFAGGSDVDEGFGDVRDPVLGGCFSNV